ncbi:MAG: family 10 glycosylhydrolase [Acidobacteriota bacterium]
MRFLLGLAPVLLLAASVQPERAEQYRAFWVDAYHAGYKNAAEVDRLVEDVVASHCNAIFLQVRRRADSYYLKTLEVPAQDPTYTQDFDALEYLIERAHVRGIEVHAWFVVYPLWQPNLPPPTNPAHLYYQHGPGKFGRDLWLSFSSTGRIGNSLEPGHPDVQRYLAAVITEPLKLYDIDGIHLDYIRYEEGADYGYNFVAVERFRRLTNANVAQPPQATPAEWNTFRRNQVTGLVRQLYLRAHELKPNVKMSAALISWGDAPATEAGFQGSASYSKVFQDWIGWMKEGILDLGVPMHYFRDSNGAARLQAWFEFARNYQYDRRYLPGIGLYLNPVSASQRQMTRLLKASLPGSTPAGIGLYSYASTSTLNSAGAPIQPNRVFLNTAAAFFGQPAQVPQLPWLDTPSTGHIAGTLTTNGGHDSWLDGVKVIIQSCSGKDIIRTSESDATGFYGFVDLPPGRYSLRFDRGGTMLHTSGPFEVSPGRVTRYDVALRAADLEAALPHVSGTPRDIYTTGDVVTLLGTNLAPLAATAASGAQPDILGGVRVYRKDGTALPLLRVSANRIDFALPARVNAQETLTIRHSGLDSPNFTIHTAPAAPSIEAIRQLGMGAYEIYTRGLGAAADRLRVLYTGGAADILETEPVSGQPGLFKVSVMVEPNAQGEFRLEAAGVLSNPFPF